MEPVLEGPNLNSDLIDPLVELCCQRGYVGCDDALEVAQGGERLLGRKLARIRFGRINKATQAVPCGGVERSNARWTLIVAESLGTELGHLSRHCLFGTHVRRPPCLLHGIR